MLKTEEHEPQKAPSFPVGEMSSVELSGVETFERAVFIMSQSRKTLKAKSSNGAPEKTTSFTITPSLSHKTTPTTTLPLDVAPAYSTESPTLNDAKSDSEPLPDTNKNGEMLADPSSDSEETSNRKFSKIDPTARIPKKTEKIGMTKTAPSKVSPRMVDVDIPLSRTTPKSSVSRNPTPTITATPPNAINPTASTTAATSLDNKTGDGTNTNDAEIKTNENTEANTTSHSSKIGSVTRALSTPLRKSSSFSALHTAVSTAMNRRPTVTVAPPEGAVQVTFTRQLVKKSREGGERISPKNSEDLKKSRDGEREVSPKKATEHESNLSTPVPRILVEPTGETATSEVSSLSPAPTQADIPPDQNVKDDPLAAKTGERGIEGSKEQEGRGEGIVLPRTKFYPLPECSRSVSNLDDVQFFATETNTKTNNHPEIDHKHKQIESPRKHKHHHKHKQHQPQHYEHEPKHQHQEQPTQAPTPTRYHRRSRTDEGPPLWAARAEIGVGVKEFLEPSKKATHVRRKSRGRSESRSRSPREAKKAKETKEAVKDERGRSPRETKSKEKVEKANEEIENEKSEKEGTRVKEGKEKEERGRARNITEKRSNVRMKKSEKYTKR